MILKIDIMPIKTIGTINKIDKYSNKFTKIAISKLPNFDALKNIISLSHNMPQKVKSRVNLQFFCNYIIIKNVKRKAKYDKKI
ncbi:hypothetical protein MSATCC23557_4840 [Metamycoplasma salivarium]|nr:hypothetical protein MSATCC23557_4840 [Metamycoplasma salivarium]